MRDAGMPSRRERSKVANTLAKTMQERLACWTEDNFGCFEETMDLIREGAPVKYAQLYLKCIELGLAKESNINININRQQDRENLQALVRSRISPGVARIAPTYTPYVEVAEKKTEEEG